MTNRASSRRGATAIEYALIAVILALAIVTGVKSIGTNLDSVLFAASDSVQDANDAF